MRNFFLASSFLLISLACYPQGTAYFKIVDKGGIEQILSSVSGYLTLGCDSIGHRYVVKWDQYFNPVWKLCFTDVRICGSGSQMIEAPDGSIYFATATRDQSVCDGPIVVFKISPDGNVLWQHAYHSLSNTLVLANAAGNSNGFILSGGVCGYAGMIIRGDPNGSIVWHRHYYFQPNPQLTNSWNLSTVSIIPEDAGYSFMSYYESAPQVRGHLFYQINDSGNLVGPHQAYVNDSSENQAFNKMIRLNGNQGYACVGSILTSSFKTVTVAFLDTAFNLVSTRKLSPDVMQFFLRDLVSTPSGHAIIACGDFFMSLSSQHCNGVVVKMDRNGTMEWFRMPKPFNNNQNGLDVSLMSMMMKNNRLFAGIWSGSDGATIAMMDTNSNGFCNDTDTLVPLENLFFTVEDTLILNSILAPTDSLADLVYNRLVYVNKFEYCGTMPNVPSLPESGVLPRVYPIPARDQLWIDPGDQYSGHDPFRIMNINGHIVFEGWITHLTELNTVSLSNGLYLLQILHQGRWISVKFAISR